MQSKTRKSAENNFITLLNFIADPAVIVDEKGCFLVVNDAFMDLTGLRKKELVGTAFFDLSVLSAKNKALLIKNLAKRMKGEQLEPYEIGFESRSGETRYAEVKAKKIDYSGQSADLVVFRDITRRKRNAKRLKEYSEKMEALVDEKAREIKEGKEKLEKIFDSSPDAIVVTDLNGLLIEVNEAAVKLYGCSSKDYLLGKNAFELIAQKEKQKLSMLVETILKDGAMNNAEYVFLTEDGRELPVEVSASFLKDSADNPVGFVAVFKDITERKKAQQALVDSEEKFRGIVENSNDVVMLTLSDGIVAYMSPACSRVLGYNPEDIVGTRPSIFHPDDWKSVHETLLGALKGEKGSDFEYRIITKTGETRWISHSWSPILENGQVKLIVSIIRGIDERKQLENSIRESEEMFRGISTSASDAILLLDKTDKVVYWNFAAEKIFGYTKDEIIGKKLNKLVVPQQHRKTHLKNLKKVLDHKAHISEILEVPALKKDGTEFPIELTVSALKLKGTPCMLEIIRDVSERKQMERQIREAEKRYRAMFDKAPIGIVLIDPETAMPVEFNEKAHQQLGYTRDEYAKLIVFDHEALETLEQTKVHVKKMLREGKDEFETKHRTKNGEIKDIINTVQVIEISGKKLVHVISRDVTEQKKIENELKLERDKLEAVTENIGAGVGIISKDYRILWANKLLKQFNGDCEGKKCYSTFNKLTDVCPNCGVKKVFETGVPIDVHEYSSQDDKGNRFWIELIVTPIKDENGQIIAALELAVNVTERKIMENKLAEYSQKLEKLVDKRTEQLKQTQAKLVKSERLATIGELAAMVGHDLRNPLTGIMGAAYYLKTKHSPELGANGKEMLETIEKAITYSNKIVNDLLEYSRDLKLELAEVTPKAMLENALSLIEVPEKIRIVDATEDKPTVKADIEKTRRVFVNLIKNAFDAMPEGGTLTVKSREVNGKLEIAFKDTGTGMSKETLSKLEGGVPLFTTKAKGMGFGVPICKRIAEAHGGKLSVESKIGKGTTVTITVPVNPKPLDESEAKWIFNESMLQTITAKQKAKQPTK